MAGASSHHFTIYPARPASLDSIPSPSSATPLTNPMVNPLTNPLATPNLQIPLASQASPPQASQANAGNIPIVAFTDSTPILRATPSGTLSIDTEAVRVLGVETAFWVAVSLAFFEFLRDRDVSQIASLHIEFPRSDNSLGISRGF